MGFYCYIKGCKSKTYVGKDKIEAKCITWHSLPTNTAVREKWAHALSVKVIPKSSRICSKHFTPVCFERSGLSRQRLKSSAVPTLLLPSSQNGALQEILTNHNDNQTKKENCTVLPKSDVEQSYGNNQQEINLNTVTVKKESDVAMPEILPEIPKKQTFCHIRYPGDINEEILSKMSPKIAIQTILMLKQACKYKDTRIKKLQKTQRCQKKKLKTLQQLLTDLRKRDLISSNAKEILETMPPDGPNLMKDIERGKVRGKYPPYLRSFALTLYFYSPRAYNYVRQVHGNKLPSSSTIRAWCSSIDGSPGVTKEAIDAIQKKGDASSQQIFSRLMADEIAT